MNWFVLQVGLDAFMPTWNDAQWGLIVGVPLVILLMWFLWKYLDTGRIPSGKGFDFKF